jgi:hypothetical protein
MKKSKKNTQKGCIYVIVTTFMCIYSIFTIFHIKVFNETFVYFNNYISLQRKK